MSAIKYTKGPWLGLDQEGRIMYGEGRIIIFSSDYGFVIAEIKHPLHDIPISKVEALANARLISAAPELLEALKGLLEAAEFGNMEQSPPGFWDKEIEFTKQAIAKAEGQ